MHGSEYTVWQLDFRFNIYFISCTCFKNDCECESGGKKEVIAHVIALGFCPSMHVGRLADVRALKHSNYAWTNDDAFAGARSMFYLCSVPVFRCGLLRLCVVTMILKCIACSANTPKSETHIHFYICI